MSNRKEAPEKRKHKRFNAKKGAFAVVISKNKTVGQIKNISKEGLSLQHVDNGEPLSGSVGIEIFSMTKDFYLKKLSGKVVRDSEVVGAVPLRSVPMRETVVQFEAMQANQMHLLDCFIQKYTIKR